MADETNPTVGADSGAVAVLEAPEAPQAAPDATTVGAESEVDWKAEAERLKAERDTFEQNLTRMANKKYLAEQEVERLKRQPLIEERQEHWQTAKTAEYDEDRVKAIQEVEKLDQKLAAVDQDYAARQTQAESIIQRAWNHAYELEIAGWDKEKRVAYPLPGHERDFHVFLNLVGHIGPSDIEEPAREISALLGDIKTRKQVEAKATAELDQRIKKLEEENRLLRERQGFDEAHASGVLNADVRGRASGGGSLSDAEFVKAYADGRSNDHARYQRYLDSL